MKQKKIIIAAISIVAILVLAACASQAPRAPTQAEQQAETRREQNANNIGTQPLSSTVLDWSNRNLGEDAVPLWLKPLVKGNTQVVKLEFGINNNARVKFSLGRRANREEARVQAGLLYAQQIASELKQYVVTAAAQTLNQAQMDIVEEITTATKITITGNERVADFYQLVETTDDRTGSRVREYIYYVVWAMDETIWDQLVRKYVNDVIGQLPDRQVQTNIANAYSEIAAASKRETELSDRDFQLMVDERAQAAENAQEREMARIRTGAQVSVAQAQADAAARYAAYRYGDPVAAAIASTTAGDIDWISALSTAAKVLF